MAFNNKPSLSYTVELGISCRKLRNKDVTSLSDPMCVVYAQESGANNLVEVGRTECIKNTLNPDFVEMIQMEYRFEEQQKLVFKIYDSDDDNVEKVSGDSHDYLGMMKCSLADTASSKKYTKNLSKKGDSSDTTYGSITVRCEQVARCNLSLTLTLFGSHLDKKDTFGKSDPYIIFKRANEDGSYSPVFETEVIENTLNPRWRPFKVRLEKLCNGDMKRGLLMTCYDWDSNGDHDLIGQAEMNAEQLNQSGATFELINPKKVSKKKYKNSGVITIERAMLQTEYTFLDYIQSGTQVNFTVAVDFTGSNGNPACPGTLHYLSPQTPFNQYTVAIRSVGEIISDYDSDRMFPALGFGAILPGNNFVSHEFAMNGNPANPFCAGIDEIISSYTNIVQTVRFSGPTNFAPVVHHVLKFAEAIRDGSNYFVLLIITDGAISDMNETKKAIVRASHSPMSIIIVGVGDCDFDNMEELDADKTKLRDSHGNVAARDIVQFVTMRDFNFNTEPFPVVQAKLAKAVLAEVPRQFLSYMKSHEVIPRPIQAPALP